VLVLVALAVAGWLLVPSSESSDLPRLARLRQGDLYETPLAFSPDGSLIATHNGSGPVTLWEIKTGRVVKTLGRRSEGVKGAFSPDGRWFAAYRREPATVFHVVSVFEVATGRERVSIEVRLPVLLDFGFCRDGATFRVIGWDHSPRLPTGSAPWSIRTWETSTWTEQSGPRVGLLTQATSSSFSPDNRLMASSTRSTPGSFHPGGWFSSDNRLTASVISPTVPGVVLWDVASGAALATLFGPAYPSGGGGVWSHETSPDGKTLAVGRSDGLLELWDVETRSLGKVLRGHSPDHHPQLIRFSADSKSLVSSAWNWSEFDSMPARLRRQVGRLLGLSGLGSSSVRPSEAIVWDLASGRERARLAVPSFAVLSADGRLLATNGADKAVSVWDLSGR
jgi:WD40 repeat protein